MSSVEATVRPQHGYTGPTGPQLSEPSYAERVRTLASLNSVATLATMSSKHAGFPFGSLMPYALDAEGRPIFLISNMAMHTQNLKAAPQASLFIAQTAAAGDPLGAARATLVGLAEPVPKSEAAFVREQYLARHGNSRSWVDFADFNFFRLQPIDIYFVGGFGVMGWVAAEEYGRALPDALASVGPGIIAHMNADHMAAMIVLAKTHAGIEATEATMTAVDRLGFYLRLMTAEGVRGRRINFLRQVKNAGEARDVQVEMVKQTKTDS